MPLYGIIYSQNRVNGLCVQAGLQRYLQSAEQPIQLLYVIQSAFAFPKQHVLCAYPSKGSTGIHVQAGTAHLALADLLLELSIAELRASLHPEGTIPASAACLLN